MGIFFLVFDLRNAKFGGNWKRRKKRVIICRIKIKKKKNVRSLRRNGFRREKER